MTALIDDVSFADLIHLEPHGPDTYVAIAAKYPWGDRLFGGQVVAQALAAAAATVPSDRRCHSLHAYFIRPGSTTEPVRYEVERLRDGRSFTTRQVVARQSTGAILTQSVSFQIDEDEADVPGAELSPQLPRPDAEGLSDHSWGNMLDRRYVDERDTDGRLRHVGSWVRLLADLPDPERDPVAHSCALAFFSDSGMTTPARRIHPDADGTDDDYLKFVGASLDHSVWFHRPVRATDWHFFSADAHGLSGGRGLSVADVVSIDDRHVATVAQQVLLRRRRDS